MKKFVDDLRALEEGFGVSRIAAAISNRGFHALLAYRVSHYLYRNKVPLVPLVITRLIQILYAIDIDYRCSIEGGVVIVHGTGLVVGRGAFIGKGTIIYHQVTLGIKHGGGAHDGFPSVGQRCVLGAGSKLLGPIFIGDDCTIGANVVVTKEVPPNSVVTSGATLRTKKKSTCECAQKELGGLSEAPLGNPYEQA